MFVGEIMQQDEDGQYLIDVKNKFKVGDSMELLTPAGNVTFTLHEMQDKEGKSLQEAPGGGWKVKIPLPSAAGEFGLLVRDL